MKITRLIAAITVSAALMLGPAVLAQEETPVDMKDLPSPAQTTIKEKAGSDQILRVAKETRKGGGMLYDAVVNRNGKRNGDPRGLQWQVYGHSSREGSGKRKDRELLIGANQIEWSLLAGEWTYLGKQGRR